MEQVLSSSTIISTTQIFPLKPHKTHLQTPTINLKFSISPKKNNPLNLSSFSSSCLCFSNKTSATSTTPPPTLTSLTSTPSSDNHHWMVLMEAPPHGVNSKPQVIEYYVKTLERVLGSEKDAQMCIYDASWDTHFGFCCDIDEEISRELAGLPGILSVRPDPDYSSVKKDYSSSNIQSSYLSSSQIGSNLLFPVGSTKHWLVRMDKPGIGVVTKAQMVDYYAQILTKVLGNEKDTQMCIYHVSWQSNFGFCCELDDECARELAGVPGVLSVQLDKNFESENKNYGGNNLQSSTDLPDPSEASQTTPIKTKKLFVTVICNLDLKTGLSFYTSEKTLRAAFEGFGQLVEVKIILDKISKRSKGYAFIEYTTEEAASAALKEMNGKIINGWMIVVDVAKTNPPRYSRGHPR
ncbi:organelle RRM domain-containing protein 1, chloroplastic-like isoform X2 [Quercus robur]|uniref:organelle RRM domain-containing protein 1, chloroplastic-like isoform X2 n=1 Tax=Quercus robur TaxID=38942 RepID=UPI00216145B3|nr:organelle RRM domain-containing protein 1, chloroplastic-like isoform X2 [Quercus robur]